MHRIAFPLALALVAGIFSTTAFGQQATSFGSGQQEANILGRLMGEQAGLKAELDALQARVRRLGSAAAPADLTPLTTRMTEIEQRLGEIETELDGKASLEELSWVADHLHDDIFVLEGRVIDLENAPPATNTTVYTSDLRATVALGGTMVVGEPISASDRPVTGRLEADVRFLWSLGDKMEAGIQVGGSPVGSSAGVGVWGGPALQMGLLGASIGPAYYCDGLLSAPAGCSSDRTGLRTQLSVDLVAAPFGVRPTVLLEGLDLETVAGAEGQEIRFGAGVSVFFGSTNQDD